jgi:transposase
MKRARFYSASEISDDYKTHLARLYIVEREQGKSRKEFVDNLRASGLDLSERSIDRWAAKYTLTGNVISTEKLTGRAELLNREQRDICSGWVLDQIAKGIAVHRETYCNFVATFFGVKLSQMTVSNYLAEDGFTYRTLQKKTASFIIDVDKLRIDAWNWVKTQKFPYDLSKIASIDFTFTGHRTERRSGFGIKGGVQPMEATAVSTYTNCIVTVVWADGINRTPPMLFTYNAAFRHDRKRTQRRDDLREHLDACLQRYGITPDRIKSVGKDKYEREHYVTESPKLLRLFFEKYKVPPGVTVFSDNGNSFFENGESVLHKLGFKTHICYPANVHQYLSPNDNRLHGTSKQTWRNSGINYSDDVDSCLRLLSYLDRDIVKHSKHWFERNMLKLQESDVADLVSSRGGKMCHLHKGWLRSYRISIGEDARGQMPELPDDLNDRLDGVYWEL